MCIPYMKLFSRCSWKCTHEARSTRCVAFERTCQRAHREEKCVVLRTKNGARSHRCWKCTKHHINKHPKNDVHGRVNATRPCSTPVASSALARWNCHKPESMSSTTAAWVVGEMSASPGRSRMRAGPMVREPESGALSWAREIYT